MTGVLIKGGRLDKETDTKWGDNVKTGKRRPPG